MPRALAVFVLLGVAAPAVAGTSFLETLNAYEAVTPCCASYAEIKYEPVFVATRRNFHIDSKAPAYQFPTGKSRFAAFALPKRPQAFRYTVKSVMAGPSNMWTRGHYYLMPTLVLLDAEHQVTRTLTAPPEFKKATNTFVVEFEATGAERYLIIYSDPAWYGKTVTYYYGAYASGLYISSEMTMPIGPEGSLTFVIEKRGR